MNTSNERNMVENTMAVMLSATEYLALTDDERYAEMCRATIATMSEDVFNKYFKPTAHRWRDLARVWDKVLGHPGWSHLTLATVIHKIYWGIFPYNPCDASTKYLYELIEAELLSDGEGYRDLGGWVVFKRTLDEMLYCMESLGKSDINTHFIEHHYYLKSRALYRLIYSKAPLLNHASDQEEHIATYCDYEAIINRLIPDSLNWSYEQWGDDTNISDALCKLYGVDYAKTYKSERDYERLIMTLTEEKNQGKSSEKFVWLAANISELPLSLAEVIWPNDLTRIVSDTLISAYRFTVEYEKSGQPLLSMKDSIHPICHFERDTLRNSWLFRLASQWFYEGIYAGKQYDCMKAVIFDLTIAA